MHLSFAITRLEVQIRRVASLRTCMLSPAQCFLLSLIRRWLNTFSGSFQFSFPAAVSADANFSTSARTHVQSPRFEAPIRAPKRKRQLSNQNTCLQLLSCSRAMLPVCGKHFPAAMPLPSPPGRMSAPRRVVYLAKYPVPRTAFNLGALSPLMSPGSLAGNAVSLCAFRNGRSLCTRRRDEPSRK